MTMPPVSSSLPRHPETDAQGVIPLLLMLHVLATDCTCGPCRVLRDMAQRLSQVSLDLLLPPPSGVAGSPAKPVGSA